MSRAHYRDYLLRQVGNGLAVLSQATVTVYLTGTTTKLTDTIYTAASGTGAYANPFTSGTDGLVEFWLDSGQRVDLLIQKAGFSDQTITADVVGENTLNQPNLIDPTVTGSLALSGVVRDGYGWMPSNEMQVRRVLGFNNGAAPSTVSRRRGFTQNDMTTFDLGAVNAQAKGLQLAAFDGRRVYYIPFGTSSVGAIRSVMPVYDTTKSFTDATAWSFPDLKTVTGSNRAHGFIGAVLGMDNWLYFIPYNTDYTGSITGNQMAFRFDTTKEVTDSSAYQSFDITTATGTGSPPSSGNTWQGGVTDGRYIYYVPTSNPATDLAHGQILRFDTTKTFTEPTAWETFDATTVNASAMGFLLASYDGQYIYFIPFSKNPSGTVNGTLLRYDTTKDFHDTNSYQAVDLEALLTPSSGLTSPANSARAVAFCGAICVGPYLVLTPWGGQSGGGIKRSLAVCYDTRLPMSDASSYRAFDLRTIRRAYGTITGATNTANCVVTTADTGQLRVGDRVNIAGVNGATGLNGGPWTVTAVTSTTFTVALTAGPGVWTSGGDWTDGANECIGYQAGGFDGQYLHFTPTGNGDRISTYKVPPFVRWDVRLPFDQAGSWSHVNTPIVGDSTNAFAYPPSCTGLAFDGRYLYHVPYGGGVTNLGITTRVECGAPNLAGMVDPLPELFRGLVGEMGRPIVEDEFRGGGSGSGQVGESGWALQAGTVAPLATELNHPGILRFTSDATSGGANGLVLDTSGSIYLNSNNGDAFDLTFIVRPVLPSATPTYRVGLTDGIANAQPTNGIYFEFLNTDANWFTVIRTGGVQVRYITGVLVTAGTWYTLRIKWDPPYMKFSINNQALQAFGSPNQSTLNAHIVPATPTLPTAALSPFVALIPSTAVAQQIDVDYCKFIHSGYDR